MASSTRLEKGKCIDPEDIRDRQGKLNLPSRRTWFGKG